MQDVDSTLIGGQLLDAADPAAGVVPDACAVCGTTSNLRRTSVPGPSGVVCLPHLDAALRTLSPATRGQHRHRHLLGGARLRPDAGPVRRRRGLAPQHLPGRPAALHQGVPRAPGRSDCRPRRWLSLTLPVLRGGYFFRLCGCVRIRPEGRWEHG